MADEKTKGSALPAIANPQAVDLIAVDRKGAPFTGRLSADHLAPMSHVGAGGEQHALATTTQAGFMSADDKTKLAGIEAGAGANAVPSVFGRTGDVAAADGDYPASKIVNDSAVPGPRVKDALETLVPKTRQVTASGSLTGGGDLTTDRALALAGDEATPAARTHYGTDHAGGKAWVSDLPGARASITNPASPYTPPQDGRLVPITITDGRTLAINKPTTTPTTPIDECVLTIRCQIMPCVVMPGTWDALDGAEGPWRLNPGDTLSLGFYYLNDLWTLQGHPIADDHRVTELPTGFGLTGPARLADVIAKLHERLRSLETAPDQGGGSLAGVTSINGLTGAVTLTAGANVTIDADGSALNIAAASGGIQTISAGGVTASPQTISFQAGDGLSLDPTGVASGVIKYTLAGDSGQTVTNVPALVYAAAPNLQGETTALVDVMPSTPLANFESVGDTQVVRLLGRINFPSTASGNKAFILTPTIGGTAMTLTGPSLAASTAGRYFVVTGFLWRHDATTLKSLWRMRFSSASGSLADGGNWPSSTASPAGQYLIGGTDVTVADWAAVTFKAALSWSADAETKMAIAEAIAIGRLGRDSDTTQAAKLFIAAGVLTTDITQTTATDVLPAQTIPAGTLEKDGAACELLIAGYVTSGSATPTLALQTKVNGVATTAGAPTPFSVGNITGQKKILVRLLIYRVNSTTARVKITSVLSAQGTSGSFASTGGFAHDTTDDITGLDFGAAITLGLSAAWSSATGTPHLFATWRHLRRVSDQLGRAVPTGETANQFLQVGSWTVPANTFAANGVPLVLRTLSKYAFNGASGTQYASYRLTVGGTVINAGHAVSGSTPSADVEFLLTRLSATTLRVVGCSLLSGMANTAAFPVITFDPAQPLTVTLEVATTSATPTIGPRYASLAGLFAGGETAIT